jgi:hypothetical protein
MPSIYTIARYWHDRGEPFDVDLAVPACFGCGTTAEITSWGNDPDEARPDFAELLGITEALLAALARPDRHPRYERRIAVFQKSSEAFRRLLADAVEAWERRRWDQAVLERAHLITRVFDGLDGPQNLAPLCSLCHRVMPDFEPGEEESALDYVRNGGFYGLVAPEGRRLIREVSAWAG